MKRHFATLLSALILTTACTAKAPDTDAATTLRIGNNGEPLTLDPSKSNLVQEDRIMEGLYEGLTVLDPAAKPIPGMAESWSISEDKLTWTFKLRDAKWSDGVPVTANDFVASFRRLFDPKTLSSYASLFYMIKNAKEVNTKGAPAASLGLTASDPKTVVIQLTNPTPFLPELLAFMLAYPVPSHVIAKFGEDWVKPANHVGNGAFVLKEWRPNDFIRLEKNLLFHDAANVCLTKVLIFPATDSATAARSVRAGELDTHITFQGQNRQALKKDLPGFVREAPIARLNYAVFNNVNPTFKDARVRQALSLAIDRDLIAKTIVGGAAQPARSIVPYDTPDYASGPVAGVLEGDLATRIGSARTLLQAAGYGAGKPLTLTLSHSSGGDAPRFVPIIQNTWQQIAPWVKVELLGADSQIHYNKMIRGDFAVAYAGWSADYNDAKTFLYLLETRSAQMNTGRYSNPVYDNLIIGSDNERDTVVRAGLLRQAEEIALKDAPLAPIFFDSGRALVNPRVTGWVDNKVNTHRMRWLCTKEAEAAR
jgi:oligopeptide transport system substrate-binding protein